MHCLTKLSPRARFCAKDLNHQLPLDSYDACDSSTLPAVGRQPRPQDDTLSRSQFHIGVLSEDSSLHPRYCRFPIADRFLPDY
jgi:hypothetical protein